MKSFIIDLFTVSVAVISINKNNHNIGRQHVEGPAILIFLNLHLKIGGVQENT